MNLCQEKYFIYRTTALLCTHGWNWSCSLNSFTSVFSTRCLFELMVVNHQIWCQLNYEMTHDTSFKIFLATNPIFTRFMVSLSKQFVLRDSKNFCCHMCYSTYEKFQTWPFTRHAHQETFPRKKFLTKINGFFHWDIYLNVRHSRS